MKTDMQVCWFLRLKLRKNPINTDPWHRINRWTNLNLVSRCPKLRKAVHVY